MADNPTQEPLTDHAQDAEVESIPDMQRVSTSSDFFITKNHLPSTIDLFDEERGCLSRWFGKMEPGSVRGSMLALAVTAIGGGTLQFFVLKGTHINPL